MAKVYSKKNLSPLPLPGRGIWKVIGGDGPGFSTKMTVGFADYSSEYGPMEPHHHAEETVYILEAEKGFFRHGESQDNLCRPIKLEAGMMIHFDPLEWHVFEYEPGGWVKIIFIYGQVDKIRPEEIIENHQ